MNNKDKLKSAIKEDINEKAYYNEIINKIKKSNIKNKNNILKWSLVPICLIVIFSTIIFLHKENNNTILKDIEDENNITFNINDINIKEETDCLYKIDGKLIDSKSVNNINFPIPYELISIPKDLDKTNTYILYIKEDPSSKEYNKIGHYEIVYYNDSRSINIKYSKTNKPIRDYFFDEEGSKTTIINNITLKMYKYETVYFTEFKYNDYNIDIETSNITEEELKTLLLSILK